MLSYLPKVRTRIGTLAVWLLPILYELAFAEEKHNPNISVTCRYVFLAHVNLRLELCWAQVGSLCLNVLKAKLELEQ